MAFEDLTEYLEPLELPIRGKVYRIPPVSFEDGLTLKSVLDGTSDPSISNDDVNRILLGAVRDEMETDGVSGEMIGRVLLTALADFRSGRFAAEIMWRTGGDPKELNLLVQEVAPNRETRRKAQKQSPSTVAAVTTKPQASTSTTKASRKK